VLEADYGVGCDGGHSIIRDQIGIARTGAEFDQKMVLMVFRSKELHEGMKRFPTKSTYNVMHPDLKGYWMFFGRIDVVVANAGISVPGTVEGLSIGDFRRQMETNVLGAVRTAKAAIGPLRETRGRLGIVGSVNGYISLPGFSAYAMSKFAVRALCDALRGELKKDGVSVTHLAPGFVESEIRGKDGRDPIPSWLVMKGDDAAREIVRALQRRKSNAVITGHGRAFVKLQQRAPKLVDKLVWLGADRILASLDSLE
jgi:short-subunit dehydrogenase